MSRIDRLYRHLILTGFFKKGWGNPKHIKELLNLRQTLSDPSSVFSLQLTSSVLDNITVEIEKESVNGNVKLVDAKFTSPLHLVLPHLMPSECQTARFQFMYASEDQKESQCSKGNIGLAGNESSPVALHLAGTGDHFYYRRRQLQGNTLLKEHGISSVMLENPFYGSRKPKDQLRSSVHYVNDIFIMGAALIMESWVILNWLLKNGYGPTFCITGVSMGGFMASLAAGFWRKFPVALVPCLSWSSAAPVYTQGVLSDSVPWKDLTCQFHGTPIFLQLNDAICHGDYGAKYIRGRHQEISSCVEHNEQANESLNFSKFVISQTNVTDNFLPHNLPINITDKPMPGTGPNHSSRKFSSEARQQGKILYPHFLKNFKSKKKTDIDIDIAKDFMHNLMDQFTHLGNYSTPLDPSLIHFLVASQDAYVPSFATAKDSRQGKCKKNDDPNLSDSFSVNKIDDMRDVWRGCSAIELEDYGHVEAYLFKQKLYSNLIKESIEKLHLCHFSRR